MNVKIYYNPNCDKSRQALFMLLDRNIQPEIKLYLEEGLEEYEIREIIDILGVEATNIVRDKEQLFEERELNNPAIEQDDIINAIIETPILLQRPIVIVDDVKGVIARPPEKLLEII